MIDPEALVQAVSKAIDGATAKFGVGYMESPVVRVAAEAAIAAMAEFDEAGMPKHLPMGVIEDGRGPEDDATAHHFVCWCGAAECAWNRALSENTRKAGTARITTALAVAEWGYVDGDHHKMWVIDQMVRALTGDGYAEWVPEDWDEGMAP